MLNVLRIKLILIVLVFGMNASIYTSYASVRYYHADEKGSIRYLSDQQGQIRTSYHYDAYGASDHSQSGITDKNPYRLNGAYGVRDEALGQHSLYHMKHRYYSARLKRFLSKDPAGIDGGHNLYAFARANPAHFMDPFGLCPESARHTDRHYSSRLFNKTGDMSSPYTIAHAPSAMLMGSLPWLFPGGGIYNNQESFYEERETTSVRLRGMAETTIGVGAIKLGALSAAIPLPMFTAAGLAMMTWGMDHTLTGTETLLTANQARSATQNFLIQLGADEEEAAFLDLTIGTALTMGIAPLVLTGNSSTPSTTKNRSPSTLSELKVRKGVISYSIVGNTRKGEIAKLGNRTLRRPGYFDTYFKRREAQLFKKRVAQVESYRAIQFSNATRRKLFGKPRIIMDKLNRIQNQPQTRTGTIVITPSGRAEVDTTAFAKHNHYIYEDHYPVGSQAAYIQIDYRSGYARPTAVWPVDFNTKTVSPISGDDMPFLLESISIEEQLYRSLHRGK